MRDTMLPNFHNRKQHMQIEDEKYNEKLKKIIQDFTEKNGNKSLLNEATVNQLRLTLKSFKLSGVSKNPQV